jgi:putative transposase
MQRNNIFAKGECYHIIGRGNYRQDIFLDESDYIRFLFLILYLQFPKYQTMHVSREVEYFGKHRVFTNRLQKGELEGRYVELVSFCLMPNHYHLVVREVVEGGISKYMQRILNSFTKYHNTKYGKIGHLFQGPFKAVLVVNDDQLLYLSAYVHINPTNLKGWKGKEDQYPWSSYQDYVGENRWGKLLVKNIVLEKLEGQKDYRSYVEKSGVREIKEGKEFEFE